MTNKEKIESLNFGKRNKNKSFSDIIYIAKDENKIGELDLFFLEIINSSSELSTYPDKEFLQKSKLMLHSLYVNSEVIDKNLMAFLNNIDIGLKKHQVY